MKKAFLPSAVFALAIGMGLALASCATMETLEKEALASVKNAALLTVICDREIDTSEFKNIVYKSENVEVSIPLPSDENFRLKPIAVKLRDDIFQRYAQGFPFALLEEQAVIGSSAYQNLAAEFMLKGRVFETPDGYTWIPILDKKVFARIVAAFPDVQAFMACSASFQLTKVKEFFGSGTAKVTARVTIEAFDRNRRVILRKTSDGSSSDSIKFSHGRIFDTSQIQPLCVQAADKARLAFEEWFAKKK
jgi:hypothetical protein